MELIKKIQTVLLLAFVLIASVFEVQAQDLTITGTVIDSQSENTLPGVNVSVKGSSTIGTSTNAKGFFELTVPSPSDTLLFTFVGYKTEMIPVQGRSDLGEIPIQSQVVEGEEVVVTGYGEEREKVSIVGSVESIKQPEKELQTSTGNLSNSFAGRVAGVTAFQRSGEPGANASEFYIRGISTFSGATSPLIIIDGVEASSGDLNSIPPEIIKSFSILKDATATAVYGSRGANGVMIVETKSGANLDSPKINVRLENTFSAPTNVPDFVGGARYMELYNQAVLGRETGEIPYSQQKIEGTKQGLNPYIFPDVDWYERLFKDQSMRQKLNVNIRGGGEKVTYFMSGTLNRDNGMLKSFNLNSYNNNITVNNYQFQNNLQIDASPTTDISLKLNTQLRDYHGPALSADQIFGLTMEANPADFPVMFPQADTTSNTIFGGKGGGRFNSGYRNPFAEMTSGYSDSFNSTILATIKGEQELGFVTEGLSFQGLASFKNWSSSTVTRQKAYNQFEVEDYSRTSEGDYRTTLDRVGLEQDETLDTSTGNTGDRKLYLEARLNYKTQIGAKHDVSAMLLYNQDEFNYNDPGGLIQSLPRRTMGFAGRFSYSYDDTYMAEFNFGYNGSENFAEDKRFGFFPSGALGYVVSNEDFWEPISDAVSLFKLRGSWGLVGNDEIGGERFVYLSDINLNGQGFTTGRDQSYGRSGPTYNRFANRDIAWEVGEKINLGLDIELFERLNITADAYQEIRRNIFLARNTIPNSFGTSGTQIYGNLGKVKNRGFDLTVNYNKPFSSDFFMALKGTFTYAHNEVMDIDEPPFRENPNLSLVGHPINSLLGLRAQRLFIDQAEIDQHAIQQLGGFVMPGDIMYRDVNGDGFINSDDRARMGKPTVPEITFGFGPSFQYKNFDFSFLLQGVARTSFFIGGFHPFGTSSIRNVLDWIAEDHWSQENQDIFAKYPRLSKLENPNNTANSSYWLRDGAFVKLRNVELGYEFNRYARIYLSGYNLMTFSKFDKWDPEMGGGSGLSYPTQRKVTVGVQLSL